MLRQGTAARSACLATLQTDLKVDVAIVGAGNSTGNLCPTVDVNLQAIAADAAHAQLVADGCDCGCHGSRFSVEGKVLEGPALVPLPRLGTPAAEPGEEYGIGEV